MKQRQQKQQQQQQPPKKKKKRSKRKYRPLRLYTRTPAARVNVNRSFLTQTRNGNSVRVTGYDLIYNTNEGVVEGPFCVVSCNPAYWNGTRVAAIANAYSQFRPLHMCFDYFPQVSTMTNGNVVTGTIWNNNTGGNNLQQSLATSNGGKIFPVYATARVPIKLQTNLNQNLFNFQGYIDSDTNPFVFMAVTQQSNNIIPGYFMVSYTFEFKNPLGDGFDYDTDVKTAGDVSSDDVWDTTSAVLLSATTAAAIGTKLVVKIIDDAVQFFLGGSRVGMVASCILKLFKSRPRQMTKQQEDIIDLGQSNQIAHVAVDIDRTQQGSSIISNFAIHDKLTLDHFQTFKTYVSGADYNVVGGLFAKLTQVGAGRYNIGFFNVASSTELVPEGLYVLRTTSTPKDYSAYYDRDGSVTIHPDNVRLILSFQNYSGVECSIPTMTSFSEAEPFVLADIALQDVEQVLGVNRHDIIGTGELTLVPIDQNTRKL